MALARTNRFSGTNNSMGTGPYTTSSFTPSDNSLLVAILSGVENSGTTDPSPDFTISDSAGLTWTRRVLIGDTASWTNGIVIWTAPVGTGTSMTITFDAGTRNMYVFHAAVIDYTGYNTSTPTSATGTNNALNPNGAGSLTLSGSPALDSVVLGACFVNNDNTNLVTEGSGWTEIYDIALAGHGGMQIQERTNSTSTTVDWVDTSVGSTANKAVGVGLELLADPGRRRVMVMA